MAAHESSLTWLGDMNDFSWERIICFTDEFSSDNEEVDLGVVLVIERWKCLWLSSIFVAIAFVCSSFYVFLHVSFFFSSS